MTRRERKGVVEPVPVVGTAGGARARSADGAAGVASAGRTDAVNSGIVRSGGRSGGAVLQAGEGSGRQGGAARREATGAGARREATGAGARPGPQRGAAGVRSAAAGRTPDPPAGRESRPERASGGMRDGSPASADVGDGDAQGAPGSHAPAAPERARRPRPGGYGVGRRKEPAGPAGVAEAVAGACAAASAAASAGDAAYGDDDRSVQPDGRAFRAAARARRKAGGAEPAGMPGAAPARAGSPAGIAGGAGSRRPAARPAGHSALPARSARRGAATAADGRMGVAIARLRNRRAWRSARAAAVRGRAAKPAAKGKLAAAASSAAAPLAGALAGIVGLVLGALAVAQAASALFGFWENADMEEALAGLPPYVTREMVDAALGCQEAYGHPAGCTLAQVIVESGDGDGLSGLAEQDRNLFGIKWSASFSSCPEVTGKASWPTTEEVDGELVEAEADFASFGSFADCIAFRSRVVLAKPRYAGNALVGEAVEGRDSDKMAEGLEDAGWATASGYADALKAAMDSYGLRRFDSMSASALGSGAGASGGRAKVVAAARSQLGVPYVWGGTRAGVGLDCSGLTQWCYAQAGVSIPRNSEDQAAAGRKVALSRAEPGDVLWRPGHVAIYIGGDRYIHEPQSGDVCRVASGVSYFTWAIRF